MKTPGLLVKPIISINGKHSLNEVFFTDVKVPKENLVGKENMGWTYAKFLLGNERTGIAGVARCKSALERLRELAAMLRNEGGHLCDDPDFARRFAAIETDLLALSHTDLRVAAAAAVGEALGPEASILKVKGTEIQQAISDLAVDALGPYAAPFDRPHGDNLGGVGPANRRGVVPAMLFGRAASIYGGTNEVQRNIVAKAVLGLIDYCPFPSPFPRPPRITRNRLRASCATRLPMCERFWKSAAAPDSMRCISGQCLPHLIWRPSDLAQNLPDIQCAAGRRSRPQMSCPRWRWMSPIIPGRSHIDGVFSANAVHIMSWDHVLHMFRGIGEICFGQGHRLPVWPFQI